MPKMNGFELYRQVKELSPNTKIAFITAFEINKDEFNKVLPSIGVKDFIIKPIDMDDLIFKIKSMIST
jgi:two-component system response regulator ChvI